MKEEYKSTLAYKSVSIVAIIGYMAILIAIIVLLYGSALYFYNAMDTASWTYKMWLTGNMVTVVYVLRTLWAWLS